MNWVVVPWASIHMKVRMSIECCGCTSCVSFYALFISFLYLSLTCYVSHATCTKINNITSYTTIYTYIYNNNIDRFTQHRYKADQAFELSNDKSPVAAYLDIDTIVKLCVQNGVQAVHPGYGFLR